MSFAVSSAGEILILAVMVGILKGVKSDASTENNTKAFSVLVAFSGGVWCKLHSLLEISSNTYSRGPDSALRDSVVYHREKTAWFEVISRRFFTLRRV